MNYLVLRILLGYGFLGYDRLCGSGKLCVLGSLVLFSLINNACNLVKHFGYKINNTLCGIVVCRDVLDCNLAVGNYKERHGRNCNAGSSAASEDFLIAL